MTNHITTLRLFTLLLTVASSFTAHSNDSYSNEQLRALQQRENDALNTTNPLVGYEVDRAIESSHAMRDKILAMSQQVNQRITTDALSEGLYFPEPTTNPNANPTGIIALVSLSMPDIALQQLLIQSEQYQIPLIIRGVLPEGFSATVARINHLLTKDHKKHPINSGIAINPQWFTQFNITQVPAFISIKEGKCTQKGPCSAEDFDVLYGNISMGDALSILSKGDAKENAITAQARTE